MQTVQAQEPIRSCFADDPDFQDLLIMFLKSVEKKQVTMRDDFASGNLEGLETSAHQLVSSGTGYGFDRMTEIARELEAACKANDIDQVGESLDAMLGYMERIDR